MKKYELWENTELWLISFKTIFTTNASYRPESTGFVTMFEVDRQFDKYRYLASNEEGIIKHRALFSKTALDGFGGIDFFCPKDTTKLDRKDLILYTNLTVHSSRFWELLNDNNL
jgi:hypothetical protein